MSTRGKQVTNEVLDSECQRLRQENAALREQLRRSVHTHQWSDDDGVDYCRLCGIARAAEQVTRCAACGSANVVWQGAGEGFSCLNCHRSDGDE